MVKTIHLKKKRKEKKKKKKASLGMQFRTTTLPGAQGFLFSHRTKKR